MSKRRHAYGLEWGWNGEKWCLVSRHGRLQRVVWLTEKGKIDYSSERAYHQALARSRDPVSFVLGAVRPTGSWHRTRKWVQLIQGEELPRKNKRRRSTRRAALPRM